MRETQNHKATLIFEKEEESFSLQNHSPSMHAPKRLLFMTLRLCNSNHSLKRKSLRSLRKHLQQKLWD